MASTTIGTAYIQIEPSTKGISGKITSALDEEASSAGKSAGSKFSSALSTSAKVGFTAVAGLATTIIGTGTALTSAASATAQYGDNIDKMSQKLGVSSSFYQEWDAVLQHSGTSIEGMSSTFKTLAKASQSASADQEEAFNRLGLSIDQVSKMSTEDLFTSVISGLQGMEEGTERTALATQLLGRGAMEMGALLNTSAEDTQAMIDTVNQLGGVMDAEGVKASAAFQDSLQDMQTAFTGFKNNALAELLPSFTEVMGGLTALLQGDGATAKEMLSQGLTDIATKITEAIPTIMDTLSGMAEIMLEVAPEIISKLGEGIISAIPSLVPSLLEFVSSIGTELINLLPQLLEVGLQVVLTLAESISSALPDLIPTIVDVVLQITETLIENVDLLIDGAIALIIGLAEGLINALPQLIEKIPEIVIKISEAFITNAPKLLEASIQLIVTLAKGLIESIPKLIEAVPKILDALKNSFLQGVVMLINVGADLVGGIKQGISNAWNHLTDWLGQLCVGLVDKVKSALKIGSPSRLFRDEVGQWIPKGISVGIDANADSVIDSMDNLNSEMLTSVNDINGMGVDYTGTQYTTQNSSNDGLYNLLSTYLPMIANGQNISLEGDVGSIFKVVRAQNDIYRNANGRSAFA